MNKSFPTTAGSVWQVRFKFRSWFPVVAMNQKSDKLIEPPNTPLEEPIKEAQNSLNHSEMKKYGQKPKWKFRKI